MNDQNYFEESYVSLSAFLCLQTKNDVQSVEPSQTITPSQNVENNGISQENEAFYESQSDQSSKGQSSNSRSQIGKSKRQKKEYSKNYRIRHKEYVQNLQSTNQKLQKKVQELNLKINQLTEEVQCLKYGRQINDNLFDNIFMREKQYKLKELVKEAEVQKKVSWQKIKQFADYYGFAGKEKINLLNYYMSQIIDNLLTDPLKNFILVGLENFQISKPYAQIIQEKERENIGCSKSNYNNLLKYLRRSMPEKIKKFHKSGQDFYDSYVHLMNQAKEIENHFTSIEEGVFKLIPPEKYMATLKWYEQNKYCKQIQLLRKDWFQSFRQK